VEHIIKRFEQTGSIKNHVKLDRPATATSPEKTLDFVEDLHNSICDIAQHNIDLALAYKS